MKLFYLSAVNLTEKWKTSYAKDWHLIKGQLAIEYKERGCCIFNSPYKKC